MNDWIVRVLKEQEVYSERARVLEVDEEMFTCKVETLDTASVINKVILSSYRGATFGLFLTPKIGSVVTVGYYSKDEAFVAKMAELERIRVIFRSNDEVKGVAVDIIDEKILVEWPESEEEESTTIEISETEIVFNGGELLGLVKIEELTARLNEIEGNIKQLQTDFSGWTPVPNDGGASLKAIITAGFGIEIIPDSQVEDFENEKIKQ